MYLFVNELEMMVKCDVKGENDKGGCIGYYMFFGVFMGLTGSYFMSVFYILLAGLINQ
jgi:hypothetical protein